MRTTIREIVDRHVNSMAKVVGRGLLLGIEFVEQDLSPALSSGAFESRVIAETCGPNDGVLKILPPLTIEMDVLAEGLNRIDSALGDLLKKRGGNRRLRA